MPSAAHYCLVAAGTFALLISDQASPAEEPGLATLAWLSGCWAADAAEAGSVEHWLPPAGGSMLGVARTVKHGATVHHEFLQIRTNADGGLVYTAMPSGQPATSFVASTLSADTVTFENPAHDFPQRISYTALSNDRLLARIEGQQNGRLQGIDFAMTRAPCELPSNRAVSN